MELTQYLIFPCQASVVDVDNENDKKEKEDCGFDKYYANPGQSDNTHSIMSASNI